MESAKLHLMNANATKGDNEQYGQTKGHGMDEQKTYCDIKNGCMICDHLLCEGKNEPINIEAKLPHIVQETMCVKCLHRWIDVRPESTWLKDCECPNCGEIGYVIGTGQILPNEDDVT